MTKLNLGDLQIAYRESAGTQQPSFLLIHGNSSSSRSFQRLLDTDLGRTHRMVAIDLPGHGDSAKASDPDSTYNLIGYARVVVEAAKALNLTEAIVVGWSLGGHIALEAAPHMPDAKGFVIFGTPPLAFPPAMDKAFLPNPKVNSGFVASLTEDEMRGYVEGFFKPGIIDIPDTFFDDIRKTDGLARQTLGGSIRPNGYTDEVEIVRDLKQPLLIIHGAHEQLVNGDYFASLETPTLWRQAVQVIADAGHAPHHETPEQFAQLLAEFAREVK